MFILCQKTNLLRVLIDLIIFFLHFQSFIAVIALDSFSPGGKHPHRSLRKRCSCSGQEWHWKKWSLPHSSTGKNRSEEGSHPGSFFFFFPAKCYLSNQGFARSVAASHVISPPPPMQSNNSCVSSDLCYLFRCSHSNGANQRTGPTGEPDQHSAQQAPRGSEGHGYHWWYKLEGWHHASWWDRYLPRCWC